MGMNSAPTPTPNEGQQNESIGAKEIKSVETSNKEGSIDLMEGQVDGANFKLGSLGRELQLKIRIKEAEDTISAQPDHFHIEAWKNRLIKDKEALDQNQTILDEKINSLPQEIASVFREKYERTMRTIIAYRVDAQKFQGSFEDKSKLIEREKDFTKELTELEKELLN